jgi:Ethanolamine utilisation protein EutQ
MTVGFARLGRGEVLDISFPFDEVLVLTKGSYTVRTEDGEEVTARAGEVIYLPAGSANSSYAQEDTEMVYVAHPPSVYAAQVGASSRIEKPWFVQPFPGSPHARPASAADAS